VLPAGSEELAFAGSENGLRARVLEEGDEQWQPVYGQQRIGGSAAVQPQLGGALQVVAYPEFVA